MRAFVTLDVLQGGLEPRSATLGHGALIGRLATAALQLDDPAVSEAHALVSLRSGGLRLLALRRRFRVGGKVMGDVGLVRGLQVELTRDVTLVITGVALPGAVPSLCWEGRQVPLLHDAASVVLAPGPELRWADEAGAAARLWRVGDDWRLRVGEARAVDLVEGGAFEVAGTRFELRSMPLSDAEQRPTVSQHDPLRLILFYDTVHLQARGRPVLVISGHAARLICELAATRAPLSWQAAAGELWGDEAGDDALRKRLDAVLYRLRQKLVAGGFRDDLLLPDGRGLLELRLGPDDVVVDRT